MVFKDAGDASYRDAFPVVQLSYLAICRLAEPVALCSIFPYAWLMVKSFHICSEDDASFYAGLLISAFSLCEAASGMFWGSLSDKIGRKPVLLMGCGGTILSLLMVGFSTSYSMALLGRALGGLLNGNIGVIQTMVSEIVKTPEHEPTAYAIMPFIWSLGTIIGPALGGLLVQPALNFPFYFSPNGLFGVFPWLLPNLVCAGIMLTSILLSYFYLKETHPDFNGSSNEDQRAVETESAPILTLGNGTTDAPADLGHESYGTFNQITACENEEWNTLVRKRPDLSRRSSFYADKTERWLTWRVGMIVIALGIYTYHSMCFDHLLPIFLQDSKSSDSITLSRARRTTFTELELPSTSRLAGGLGLSTQKVGVIISIQGIIALLIQGAIFPMVAGRLGIFRTFMLVTILHPSVFFLMPYLTIVPQNFLMLGIYVCLTIRQFLSILDYPVLLILLKQACPSNRDLGKINGLAASIGAACRMVAPPIAGLLYGLGRKMEFCGLAWYGAGLVAMIGSIQLFIVPRPIEENSTVHSALERTTSRVSQDMSRNANQG